MSGGSYNYLCFRSPADLCSGDPELASMMEALDKLKDRAPTAAVHTRAVFEELERARKVITGHMARLCDVWHAVEWRDSGDWGDEQLYEALAEYESAHRGDDYGSA